MVVQLWEHFSLLFCFPRIEIYPFKKIYLFIYFIFYFYLFLFFFFVFLPFLGPLPAAYGGSQARGQIRAVAAGLHHSNAGSELRLQPTPQLTATPYP